MVCSTLSSSTLQRIPQPVSNSIWLRAELEQLWHTWQLWLRAQRQLETTDHQQCHRIDVAVPQPAPAQAHPGPAAAGE
eukprot:1149868-Pelagomonas_calceolata.AAC.1